MCFGLFLALFAWLVFYLAGSVLLLCCVSILCLSALRGVCFVCWSGWWLGAPRCCWLLVWLVLVAACGFALDLGFIFRFCLRWVCSSWFASVCHFPVLLVACCSAWYRSGCRLTVFGCQLAGSALLGLLFVWFLGLLFKLGRFCCNLLMVTERIMPLVVLFEFFY